MNITETDELKERIEESGLLAHDVLRHDLEEEEVVFPLYLFDGVEEEAEL